MNQDKKNMDVLKYFRKLKEGGPTQDKKKKYRVVPGMKVGDKEGGNGSPKYVSASSIANSRSEKIDKKVSRASKRGINPDWVKGKYEEKQRDKDEAQKTRNSKSNRRDQKSDGRKADRFSKKLGRKKDEKDTMKSIKNYVKGGKERRKNKKAKRSNAGKGQGGGCVNGICT